MVWVRYGVLACVEAPLRVQRGLLESIDGVVGVIESKRDEAHGDA